MEVISLQPDEQRRQQFSNNKKRDKGAVINTRLAGGKPCTCGLCNCNKQHKCPVHYNVVPKYESSLKLPKSEYCTIYCRNLNEQAQQHPPGPQRGIKLYPRILPSFPKYKLESTTVYDRAFPNPGLQKPTQNFKPEEAYVKSNSKFYDETSYKAEFFEHPMTAAATSPQHHQVEYSIEEEPLLLPSDIAHSYETSNNRFFPHWKDTTGCRPLPYGELYEEPFFTGTFNDETVTKREYGAKVTEPRATCYPIEHSHIREGRFADSKNTTTKETFTLPCLVKRDGPFLKNNSKRNEESKVKEEYVIDDENLTQYQRDNPPFMVQPEKRKMKPPQMETISLSMPNNKLPQITVQTSSYPNWGHQKVPDLLKREDETEPLTGPFIDITEYNTEFIPRKSQINDPQICNNEKKREHEKSIKCKVNSNDMQKQVYHSEKIPFPISVNHSDYFKFNKTVPRYRHGDKAERLYKGPSSTKFGCPTKYQLDFPCKKPEPNECFKPIEKRPILGKFKGVTSYTDDYPLRPLPIRSVCPAAQILQLQPFY